MLELSYNCTVVDCSNTKTTGNSSTSCWHLFSMTTSAITFSYLLATCFKMVNQTKGSDLELQHHSGWSAKVATIGFDLSCHEHNVQIHSQGSPLVYNQHQNVSFTY